MPDRPILMLSEAIELSEREPRPSVPPRDLILPQRGDQARDLLPKFRELSRKLRERELRFRSDPGGADPTQILVFELLGTSSDFYKLVRKINGLEWFLDDDAGLTDPGQDFFYRDDPTKKIPSRVLAISTNATALSELLRLFRRYRKGQDLPHGFGQFNELFAHVREIRQWGFAD